MVQVAIFNLLFYGLNSTAVPHIHSTFDTYSQNEVLDVVLPSTFTSHKIHNGGPSESEIHISDYKLPIIAGVCTKVCQRPLSEIVKEISSQTLFRTKFKVLTALLYVLVIQH